jgi:hypothetical protein
MALFRQGAYSAAPQAFLPAEVRENFIIDIIIAIEAGHSDFEK